MTTTEHVLRLPDHVLQEHRDVLHEVAGRNVEDHGDDLGMVLSGSVGRGVATPRSDVDVYVVLTEQGMDGRRTRHAEVLDEIPVPVSELDDLPVFGTEGWYHRWSFAWAPVLLDRSGGRVGDAVRRQAGVDAVEAESILLLEHDRLDGWLNYAYRALKNDRDGRPLELVLGTLDGDPRRSGRPSGRSWPVARTSTPSAPARCCDRSSTAGAGSWSRELELFRA